MSTNLKFVQFLKTIFDASREGKVVWKDEPEESTYSAFLSRAVLQISRGFDEVLEHVSYHASLKDFDGTILEELGSGNEGGLYAQLLEDLFSLARRRARDVDALLDDLMKDVGKASERPPQRASR